VLWHGGGVVINDVAETCVHVQFLNILSSKSFYNNNNTRLTAHFRDYPGEPVPVLLLTIETL